MTTKTMEAFARNATPLERTAESDFVRIGVLLLSTDLTTEQDFERMRPQGEDRLRLHAARLHYANPVTPDTLRAMGPRLTDTAALLPPDTPLAAIYYSCTSGTAVLGHDAVCEAIRAARPDVPPEAVVTPISASVAAFRALGAGRISVLTPYRAEATRPVAETFAAQGLEVVNVSYLGLEDDRDMARLTPESVAQAAEAAMAPDADALFVSCTALRSAQVAGAVEARTGRPMVTSNQAAVWRCFTLAGLVLPDARYGCLMSIDNFTR